MYVLVTIENGKVVAFDANRQPVPLADIKDNDAVYCSSLIVNHENWMLNQDERRLASQFKGRT